MQSKCCELKRTVRAGVASASWRSEKSSPLCFSPSIYKSDKYHSTEGSPPLNKETHLEDLWMHQYKESEPTAINRGGELAGWTDCHMQFSAHHSSKECSSSGESAATFTSGLDCKRDRSGGPPKKRHLPTSLLQQAERWLGSLKPHSTAHSHYWEGAELRILNLASTAPPLPAEPGKEPRSPRQGSDAEDQCWQGAGPQVTNVLPLPHPTCQSQEENIKML